MRNPSGCCSYERGLFLGLDGLLGGVGGDPPGPGGALHEAIRGESFSHRGRCAFSVVIRLDVGLDCLESVAFFSLLGGAGGDAEFLVALLDHIGVHLDLEFLDLVLLRIMLPRPNTATFIYENGLKREPICSAPT